MRTPAFIFIVLSFISGCAIQVPPEGGQKDTIPPVILSMTPENFSTNYSGEVIKISFNEFIQLKNLSEQLVVSPLLNTLPETRLRKKTLEIIINDTLLPNTTYTMNFGNSIGDLNEGNPIPNFQYVFSTGNIIDSLQVSGSVSDAFTLKPEKNVLVMLYKEDGDSLPYLSKPLYFARTDEAGNFSVRNITPGKYKIVALKETAANYMYEQGKEHIGFRDSLVIAGSAGLRLNYFREPEPFRLTKYLSEEPGKAAFIFTGAADTIDMEWPDGKKLNIRHIVFSEKKDTMTVWYENRSADSLTLIINTPKPDTSYLRLMNLDNKQTASKKQELVLKATGVLSYQHFNRPFPLFISRPVESARFDSVIIMQDSIRIEGATFSFTDSLHQQLNVSYNWKEKSSYTIVFPKGTFTDLFGIVNDSTGFRFTTSAAENYASLNVTFKAPRYEGQYLFQLVDGQENVHREQIVISDTTFEMTWLNPLAYRVKCIYDADRSGSWTTGNYLFHRQPEKVVYYPEAVTVRANWDVELTWDITATRDTTSEKE